MGQQGRAAWDGGMGEKEERLTRHMMCHGQESSEPLPSVMSRGQYGKVCSV